MKTIVKVFALAALMGACGSNTSHEDAGLDESRALLDDPNHVRYPEGQGDSFNFIVLGGNYAGLVKYAKNDYIRICLQGSFTTEQVNMWQRNINDVTMKWLDGMRGLTSAPLAKGAMLVTSNCHGRVLVQAQNNAYTEIMDPPRVVLAPSGYYGSYNVLLHEFGHAFGLGDTYMNGTSGYCQPGQPQAVMCNTSFSNLQADDLAGMARVFKRVYPNDRPAAL